MILETLGGVGSTLRLNRYDGAEALAVYLEGGGSAEAVNTAWSFCRCDERKDWFLESVEEFMEDAALNNCLYTVRNPEAVVAAFDIIVGCDMRQSVVHYSLTSIVECGALHGVLVGARDVRTEAFRCGMRRQYRWSQDYANATLVFNNAILESYLGDHWLAKIVVGEMIEDSVRDGADAIGTLFHVIRYIQADRSPSRDLLKTAADAMWSYKEKWGTDGIDGLYRWAVGPECRFDAAYAEAWVHWTNTSCGVLWGDLARCIVAAGAKRPEVIRHDRDNKAAAIS